MSELIKREDAIKITWQEPQYYDPINALTEVREKIRALPTVDAVPVVRCKECKHYCGEETYTNHRICKMWNEEVFANGYCYYGERKDGERKDDERTDKA